MFRAVLCVLLAAAILSVTPILFGSPHPLIRINWGSFSPADRIELERRFHLTEAVLLQDNLWRYLPSDTSADTLRRIVTHPSVVRTYDIDRRAFRIAKSAALSPRRGGVLAGAPPWMARTAKLLAYVLVGLAALLLFRAVLATSILPPQSVIRVVSTAFLTEPVAALRLLPGWMHAWMQRGVPDASAEAAGLFRIVFGAAALTFVMAEPVYPGLIQPNQLGGAEGPYGMVVRWLSAHPDVVSGLGTWLQVSGILFVAGFCTAASFACFVCGFLLWACVFTLTTSPHAVAVLGMTLTCLLGARWGDAYSIDAGYRRIVGRPRPATSGREYGYVIWIPRLVFGIAFLAAAWSKVGSGFDWILNGTVKYHFVTDLDHAFVPWGPVLTQYHWVAVLMSGSAVLIEALLITAAFSRSERYILLLAAATMGLLTGFALFQGVVWWGWWIVLLSFLPWQRVRLRRQRLSATSDDAVATGRFTFAQTVVVVAVLLQQPLVSLTHLEARPLLSTYDMYSATYANAEEYEDATNLVYRMVVFENGKARNVPECTVDDRVAALLRTGAVSRVSERERIRSLLGRCLEADTAASAFTLEGDREVYDWEARRFEWRRALDVIGPFPADWLR